MVVNLSKCNTKEGISKSFTSLASFNEVLEMRHYAGYIKKYILQDFIVSGALFLDTCGNVMKISKWENEKYEEIPFKDIKLPTVIGKNDLKLYGDFSFAAHISNDIPKAHTCCHQCGKVWTISDFLNNVIVKRTNESLNLADYVGKEIEVLIKDLANAKDAIYNVSLPYNIHDDNSNFIEVGKDYIVKSGDYIYSSKWMYYHKECIKAKRKSEIDKCIVSNGKDYVLPNVAGLNEEVDTIIKGELEMAGINITYDPNNRPEAKTIYSGILGDTNDFKFYRAWSYWTVEGLMPLELAIKMYNDPIGRKYVRVRGNAGCPHPEEWVDYVNENGKIYRDKSELNELRNADLYRSILNSSKYIWVDNPSAVGIPVIPSYHIDTLDGLKLFVKMAKETLQNKGTNSRMNRRIENI